MSALADRYLPTHDGTVVLAMEDYATVLSIAQAETLVPVLNHLVSGPAENLRPFMQPVIESLEAAIKQAKEWARG